MQLQDFINRVTRALPQASAGTIAPASIIFEINQGCRAVNLIARCWFGTMSYSLPAATQWAEMSLSQCFPGYVGVKKTGLWFFDTNGTSHYIYAKTKRWLDNKILNWRDSSGATIPTWSYINGDKWFFYPYVNVAGCKATIDCLVAPTPMTSNTNYPWSNGATEYTALSMFDDAICSYAIWKLAPAVFDKEGRNVAQQDFMASMKTAQSQFKNQESLTSDLDYSQEVNTNSGLFLPR
jgi:hypothetical protein